MRTARRDHLAGAILARPGGLVGVLVGAAQWHRIDIAAIREGDDD
ncbi:MAG: hypothetical protein ACE5E5_15735 [Phycisphaerae bacterium]